MRVGFLDEARGLCILLMVIYHGAYDIVYIFQQDIPAFHWPVIQLAQPVVAGIFIFISGICCRFSRSNLKRGAIALALGLAMSVFTVQFMPDQAIYFGILHFLGTSMILFALLHKALNRILPVVGFLLCAGFFVFTWGIRWGYVGIPHLLELHYPPAWSSNLWLLPFGFSAAGADHFPLLPWVFVFFAGSFVGVPFAMHQMPEFFYRRHSRFLAFVGRHTIYVYVLHQPIVYGLLHVFFLAAAQFT